MLFGSSDPQTCADYCRMYPGGDEKRVPSLLEIAAEKFADAPIGSKAEIVIAGCLLSLLTILMSIGIHRLVDWFKTRGVKATALEVQVMNFPEDEDSESDESDASPEPGTSASSNEDGYGTQSESESSESEED